MADISKIQLPSGTEYNLKDAWAREQIEALDSYTEYLGVTTTALADGATTNPITIGGKSVTAKKGNIANYGSKEFIFNGTAWQEFGDMSGLGALAYKDSASGSYTPAGTVSKPTFNGTQSTVAVTATANTSGNYQPAGTVSKPTFTGSETTSTGNFTPEGSVTVTTDGTTNKTAAVSPASSGTATYTPAGTVSAPTLTVTPSTTTVNSITDVGALPSWTGTVSNETLTIGWSAGTLPTKGDNTTVATGISSATATAPKFTGTGVRLVTGNIPVPNSYTATFTGTEGSVSVTGTPAGSVSQPTFTGTKVQLAGTTTASGTVSQPTFTGTAGTVSVS